MNTNRDDIVDYILNQRLIIVDGWYHYLKLVTVSDLSIEILYENTNLCLSYLIRIDLNKPFKFSFYTGDRIQKKAFQKAFYKDLPRNLKIQKIIGE